MNKLMRLLLHGWKVEAFMVDDRDDVIVQVVERNPPFREMSPMLFGER